MRPDYPSDVASYQLEDEQAAALAAAAEQEKAMATAAALAGAHGEHATKRARHEEPSAELGRSASSPVPPSEIVRHGLELLRRGLRALQEASEGTDQPSSWSGVHAAVALDKELARHVEDVKVLQDRCQQRLTHH